MTIIIIIIVLAMIGWISSLIEDVFNWIKKVITILLIGIAGIVVGAVSWNILKKVVYFMLESPSNMLKVLMIIPAVIVFMIVRKIYIVYRRKYNTIKLKNLLKTQCAKLGQTTLYYIDEKCGRYRNLNLDAPYDEIIQKFLSVLQNEIYRCLKQEILNMLSSSGPKDTDDIIFFEKNMALQITHISSDKELVNDVLTYLIGQNSLCCERTNTVVIYRLPEQQIVERELEI